MENIINKPKELIVETTKDAKQSSVVLLIIGGIFMTGFYILQRNEKALQRKISQSLTLSKNFEESFISDEGKKSSNLNIEGSKSQLQQQKVGQKVYSDLDEESEESEDQQQENCVLHKFLKKSSQNNNLKIVVTTENKEKVQALKDVIKQYNSKIKVQNRVNTSIQQVKSESGIPHGQPWGIQHTYEGANSRIQSIKKQYKNGQLDQYDILISIENGVFDVLTHEKLHGFDVCCVIIENLNTGETHFSFSQSRQYPLSDVFKYKEQKVENSQIGKNIAEYYQNKQDNLLQRKDQIEQCISSVFKMFN